jgi:hypothetical protein
MVTDEEVEAAALACHEAHAAWLRAALEATVDLGLAAPPPLTFRYRNWRGEVADRTVRPLSVWYGSTDWHPEPQWLLKAIDVEKGVERDFAIRDICPSPSPEHPVNDDALVRRLDGLPQP